MTSGRAAVRSVCILVCTYKRPLYFGRLVEDIRNLEVPPGVEVVLAIADNNEFSERDGYIGSAVKDLGIPVVYGHEPSAGYSNARNEALRIGLKTSAELFVFIDDDLALPPDWLRAHVEAHQELASDVVTGALAHVVDKHRHGEFRIKCGAGNVSFRRSLVDPAGSGLQFDGRFNKTGREDQDFFGRAAAAGHAIRYSDKPIASDRDSDRQGDSASLRNKMLTTALMNHNDVAMLVQQRSFGKLALKVFAAAGLALKSAWELAHWAFARGFLPACEADNIWLNAEKEARKAFAQISGLSGKIRPRQELRRNL